MEFKLLVVDDEPAVTAALAAVFTERGYRLLQAGSGDEALALLEQEPVDLVLLDLHMPGIPGEHVLERLKTTAPQTKVIVVTAYPEREPAVRALGGDGFLAKPLRVNDLTALVEGLLTQKDEEELKTLTMGATLAEAASGQPVARLLLVEPAEPIAKVLIAFLSHPRKAQGHYQVEWVQTLPHAVTALVTTHPDLVLLNVSSIQDPAAAVHALAACPAQPKDYLFYMRPKAPEVARAVEEALVAQWWEGNPWQAEDLATLAHLVRQTAQAHGLLKR